MADLTPRQAQILDLLKSKPRGMTPKQVAATVFLTQGRATEILRSLRKLGLASNTSAGCATVWTTPERCETLRKIQKEQMAARRRALMNRRAAALEEEQRAMAWLRPVCRTVPASACSPLRPLGPNSVFNLASA